MPCDYRILQSPTKETNGEAKLDFASPLVLGAS